MYVLILKYINNKYLIIKITQIKGARVSSEQRAKVQVNICLAGKGLHGYSKIM